MGKTYILDTNVLLTNPKAFFSFKKHTIVIPYVVIEELEKQKQRLGEPGMNARDCSRQLSVLLKNQTTKNLRDGIKLENGATLMVLPSSDFPSIETTEESKKGDDYILTVCVGFQGNNPKEKVILVTNDIILKLRASSFGISTETYDQKQNIQNLEDLYQGYTKIEVKEEILAEFWEQYPKNETFSIPLKNYLEKPLYPNDFIIFNSSKKKPFAILRVIDEKGNYKFVQEQKIDKIVPLNAEQTMAIELLMDPSLSLVTLTGISGTGKTLLSLAAGIEQVINKKYDTMIIIRPTHPIGRDIGFLPGSIGEKLEPWLTPIRDNLKFLMPSSNNPGKKKNGNCFGYEYLIDRGLLEIEAMNFIRGRSIKNSFVLIDESQNIDPHELKAILTRAAIGSKIVLTGDIEQTDRIDVDSVSNGLSVAIEKFKKYSIAGHISLKEGVRSELSALAATIL